MLRDGRLVELRMAARAYNQQAHLREENIYRAYATHSTLRTHKDVWNRVFVQSDTKQTGINGPEWRAVDRGGNSGVAASGTPMRNRYLKYQCQSEASVARPNCNSAVAE